MSCWEKRHHSLVCCLLGSKKAFSVSYYSSASENGSPAAILGKRCYFIEWNNLGFMSYFNLIRLATEQLKLLFFYSYYSGQNSTA